MDTKKVFPEVPTPGTVVVLHENRKLYTYRDGKWDLAPLIDRFKGDDQPGPIVTKAHPVVVDGDTVLGAGRLIENTFTIKDLEDLETI